MQACSVSPPPPGALGADSLGLALDAVGEATVPVASVPPLDSMICGGAGDRGATAAISGTGAAMAEGGGAEFEMDVVEVVDAVDAAAAAAAAAAA